MYVFVADLIRSVSFLSVLLDVKILGREKNVVFWSRIQFYIMYIHYR